jgi:hypothetical protein
MYDYTSYQRSLMPDSLPFGGSLTKRLVNERGAADLGTRRVPQAVYTSHLVVCKEHDFVTSGAIFSNLGSRWEAEMSICAIFGAEMPNGLVFARFGKKVRLPVLFGVVRGVRA